MLRNSNAPYVCWRCASRKLSPNVFPRADVRSLPRTSYPSWKRTLATVQHPISNGGSSNAQVHTGEKGEKVKLPIRERLSIWDEENRDEANPMVEDYPEYGELANSFTRPQNVSMGTFEISEPLFDGDELGDLRAEDATLNPGDMVELSSDGSRRPMLAICLGRYNGYEHYYTSSGKWFTGLGVKTLFVVHNFVQPKELEPVIKELPSGDTPVETLNALQDLGHGPSRKAGASLLRKMLGFVQEAEAVYQENAGTLDASSAFIGDPVKHRYLTLHEITELLLPESYLKDGKYDHRALYAVHRALFQDEVFFRPLRRTGHKRSYLFEVSPLSEVRVIQWVEIMVRSYLEKDGGPVTTKQGSWVPLHGFIEKARDLIDHSRKHRQFTNSGMVGPWTKPLFNSQFATNQWSKTELEILQFMELWASYQKFPAYSRLQCLGSSILRALDRYHDANHLAVSTGWTFLQEIGWIPSWEIPARYGLRFPGVDIQRGGSYIRPYFGMLDRHLKDDALAPMRKVWENVTAYCIDSEATVDIDDAVSIERTPNPSQYWIHIHVADPASSIHAETPVAKHAELIPQTIYLSGHFERMLPDSISQGRFSLAPGRPCLTFSALMDKEGVILEHNITPGILEDVVYMTGEDVSSAIEGKRNDPITTEEKAEMSLGPIPKAKPAPRKMTRPKDLSNDQKEELTLLSELGRAIQTIRLSKGATPFFQPRPEAQAYFDHIPWDKKNNLVSILGDPAIRVAYSQRTATDLVEHAMRLAGEIAARWCHERGIPIPFRSQPHAVQNAAQVQQYTRDVFYPLLKAGIRPDDNQWRQLHALIGSDEITTTAGPHFTLGVDMYTKATSPLRRFSDLIVHWQIEAALLEERRRGTSLIGNKDDDASFLPFSRERLDRMLPMIRVREKQARALASGDGGDQWILQALVRAWRFGEAQLPETFRFSVVHVHGRRSIQGRLDWFERSARLRPDALNDVLKMADARVGDVYEVKLQDVNVHANQILVEVLRVIEKTDDKKSGDEESGLLAGGGEGVKAEV
ncbi:RNB-domain-containing protein [Hypoxylon trugodes]|uniref:RNB-domain-containing protein n=1 Tax=Hypoxylon trugodes TaxID=326681 RepID=UPI0021A231BE|nr:RNB-domain-containing protein [Hypoxylon trugodes]KAI1385106.1 RNB-domain-containing protein [Hypoxylon trugodes]